MLKIVLVDRLWAGWPKGFAITSATSRSADFWANRLLVAALLEPSLVIAFLADLAQIEPEPSSAFCGSTHRTPPWR